ncbi:sensor histidine kinase [Erythrobacter litoralis]|uniref:Two-component signal transduction histidine kinase n=1 Tax=Erythrobacter litoralis (strain HTCC2594) TaxID=314225 RepID=Q2N6R8_ERYLH|nr:histidine kinase [Erythrobacter litoralis]ABC64623.1 two-component signal transduction histidine kinase [Erythrobacter litoralis HTCC2594]
MAMLPFRPTPFFENKNRAFWNLQFAGWTGAIALRSIQGISNGQPPSYLILMLIVGITGFAISTLLSVVYRQLINRPPLVTWGATAAVLAIAVTIYALVEAWVISLYFADRDTTLTQLVLIYLFFDFSLLGAWTGLYYAINFFLQVEEQADRLERLELQATSAQLAMLRYQLNPHFLFNTLNSISTLVLLKQTEPANAMLTRLSGFLRHTLITEPGGKVTVAQEVETLKLYLDIERMRFEERLRTEFDVSDAAAKAMLPSLLLQPLVENAIKYAVSPQEEGARITLAAQLVGERLRVVVSDTGPGLQRPETRASLPLAMTGAYTSTGVGLANIRDRLAQAYGEDHLFEIRTPDDGGFTVIIEIPHESASKDSGEADPPRLSEPGAAATDTLPDNVESLAARRATGS